MFHVKHILVRATPPLWKLRVPLFQSSYLGPSATAVSYSLNYRAASCHGPARNVEA
jgi:hypothetical protein